MELRIAVAEGVLSREEADALGEEARRKKRACAAGLWADEADLAKQLARP